MSYEIPIAPGYHRGIIDLGVNDAGLIMKKDGKVSLVLPESFGDTTELPNHIRFAVSLFQLICDDGEKENVAFGDLLNKKWDEIKSASKDMKLH